MRAGWLATSKVRFLYGLLTYISFDNFLDILKQFIHFLTRRNVMQVFFLIMKLRYPCNDTFKTAVIAHVARNSYTSAKVWRDVSVKLLLLLLLILILSDYAI